MEPWEERVADPLVASDVVSQILNSDVLVQHFGHWPPFEDAELISLRFHRRNHMDVVGRGDWDHREPPTLEATFYVFNVEVAPDSRDRRPAHVSLTFSELHEVDVKELSHQNPILGLGIQMERLERMKKACFRVDWGGIGHEVSLLCDSVAVLSVDPLV